METSTTVYIAEEAKVSKKRSIGNVDLMDVHDKDLWEAEYAKIMDQKYAKNTRNYSTKVTGTAWNGIGNNSEPPIYLIPRERGGPSYKNPNLVDGNNNPVSSTNLQYALISKGYGMQDVSSFTLGPIVGEGLCLVNAAFSKSIYIMHIEGGGKLDLTRTNFWRRARKPQRIIRYIDQQIINIDGKNYVTAIWLKANEHLWLAEWSKWRAAVALCSVGDFHWNDGNCAVHYRYKGEYIPFAKWKKECYIRPSYELLPENRVIKFLEEVWKKHKRPLGLVHPKAITGQAETPITREYLEQLFNSKDEMCCQPFVVAGYLMGVKLDD